jgi:hypothetical protein
LRGEETNADPWESEGAKGASNFILFIPELSMREKQVSDLRLELERVNGDLHSYKQKYYEMKRALDADEARRLRVPSPASNTTPK